MTVDWFTLIAQIINFLILVYLLKRFLYGPIIKAMEKRRAEVARRVEEAREQQEQAEEEVAAYQSRRKELEDQAGEMLSEAAEEAKQRRQELLEEARQEVEQTRQRWEEALQREQEDALATLRHRVARQVLAITRRVLRDLADAELQERVVQAFIRRLAELSDEDRRSLLEALPRSDRQLQVRSAFALSDASQARLRSAVQEHVSYEARLGFEVSEDILGGVELLGDGVKVGWSVDDYLADLEGELSRALGGVTEEVSGG